MAVQCTLTGIPTTEFQRNQLKLPFYVIYKPAEEDVKRYVFENIVRCSNCRAYMNKFNEWIVPGREWKCCFCKSVNKEVGGRYNQLNSQTIAMYPELNINHFEMQTDSKFTRREMKGSCVVFAVDEMLWETTKKGIISVIKQLEEETRVGIVIYGEATTILKYTNNHYSMDVYPVETNDLLLNVKNYIPFIKVINEESIDSLDKIEIKKEKTDGCCFGTTMRIISVLLGNYGGKVICIHGSQPTLGDGKLNPLTTDMKTFRSTHDEFYDDLAVEMNNSMITVDMFFNLQNAFDTSTLSDFARRTGGKIRIINTVDKFSKDLTKDIIGSVYREAVFRVRMSRNIVTKNRYGNYHLRNNDLLSVPCMDPSNCFVVEYEILPNTEYNCVFIQTVLLYTTENKERIIRVNTIALPHNNKPDIDPNALAISCNVISSVKAIRDGLEESKKYLMEIAKGIPYYCTQRNAALYYLYCLTKSPNFKKNGYVCSAYLRTMVGESTFPLPILYSINSNGEYKSVTLSYKEVQNCVAVMVLGDDVIIGIDRLLEKKMIKMCFGVSTITEIATKGNIFVEENEVSNAIKTILKMYEDKHVRIDCTDNWKDWLIVDDNYHDGWDYSAFLRTIQ